jgi:type II secretory pathway component PulF
MISLCCTPPKPDYQELSHEERTVFCKQVYLLRKSGYSIADAQAITYRRVLEESIAAVLGKEP